MKSFPFFCAIAVASGPALGADYCDRPSTAFASKDDLWSNKTATAGWRGFAHDTDPGTSWVAYGPSGFIAFTYDKPHRDATYLTFVNSGHVDYEEVIDVFVDEYKGQVTAKPNGQPVKLTFPSGRDVGSLVLIVSTKSPETVPWVELSDIMVCGGSAP